MVKKELPLKEKLLEFVNIVRKEKPLVLAVLYGSYARETPREFSDIDIALFFKEIKGKRLDLFSEISRIAWKVDSLIEVNVFSIEDLFSANNLNFVGEILETGKIIYINHNEIHPNKIKQLLKKLGKRELAIL